MCVMGALRRGVVYLERKRGTGGEKSSVSSGSFTYRGQLDQKIKRKRTYGVKIFDRVFPGLFVQPRDLGHWVWWRADVDGQDGGGKTEGVNSGEKIGLCKCVASLQGLVQSPRTNPVLSSPECIVALTDVQD